MTDWELLFDPSKVFLALMTHKNAIDVQYRCPTCHNFRAVPWIFPDTQLEFVDKCCDQFVLLSPKAVVQMCHICRAAAILLKKKEDEERAALTEKIRRKKEDEEE